MSHKQQKIIQDCREKLVGLFDSPQSGKEQIQFFRGMAYASMENDEFSKFDEELTKLQYNYLRICELCRLGIFKASIITPKTFL